MLSTKCTHKSTKMHGSYYKTLAHHNIVLSRYKQPNKPLVSTHSILGNKRDSFTVSWKGGQPLPQQGWKAASFHEKGRRRKKGVSWSTNEAQPKNYHNLS